MMTNTDWVIPTCRLTMISMRKMTSEETLRAAARPRPPGAKTAPRSLTAAPPGARVGGVWPGR